MSKNCARIQVVDFLDRACSSPKCMKQARYACEFGRDQSAWHADIEQIITRFYCKKHMKVFAKNHDAHIPEDNRTGTLRTQDMEFTHEEYAKRWAEARQAHMPMRLYIRALSLKKERGEVVSTINEANEEILANTVEKTEELPEKR